MAQLVLYYSPGACSLAAHIALREWGKPFEARRVMIAKGEHLAPDYLALNPHGRIPLLLVDGRPVRELSGILTWIGQQAGLYPETGSYEAARCGEWLGWLTSSVHISFALIWRGERFIEDKRLFSLVRERGYDWLRKQFMEIEQQLALGGPYLLGERYTVADCNIFPFYRWASRIGFDMTRTFPAWTGHTERLLKRRAVREAVAVEEIDMFQPTDPGFSAAPSSTRARLAAFDAAWTAGDVDALMREIAPDCVYSASVGPEPGETFVGRDAVRAGIVKLLAHDDGRARQSGETWFFGDFAFSTWSFRDNSAAAQRTIRGIDYFEFSPQGITRKDAFRKAVS